MGFRTQIIGSRILVYNERCGEESLQLEIAINKKSESQILKDIDTRFSTGMVYPFSNSMRFSLVVGNKFLFLRGNRLEIYSDAKFDVVEEIEAAYFPDVIDRYFGYDIQSLL